MENFGVLQGQSWNFKLVNFLARSCMGILVIVFRKGQKLKGGQKIWNCWHRN